MKKALKWLNDHNIDYTFHDYKKLGIDKALLDAWLSQAPWEELVNRRGTTWRKLPDDIKNSIDQSSAIAAMCDNPSLIKRPVLDVDGSLTIGFSADNYQSLLA
jgi:arsenate reductase